MDFTQLETYKENNRFEAKAAQGGLPRSVWETVSAFSNPGGFRVGLEDAYVGGNSDPRNETMMKMFTLINIGECAGGGIPDMVKKWTSAGYGRPVLSERVNPERSSIFLPLEKESGANISSLISSSADEISLDDDQKAVLDVMKSDPAATYPEIARVTGFSESKVYRISGALRKKGVVERVGSRKTGTWRVFAPSSVVSEG